MVIRGGNRGLRQFILNRSGNRESQRIKLLSFFGQPPRGPDGRATRLENE